LPVREFTGLDTGSVKAPVIVVDRPRWVQANLATFEVLSAPFLAKLQEAGKAPTGVAKAVSHKVGALEVGGLMAYMSSRVLGQFDPFWRGPDGEQGRLMLVAPNIEHVSEQLGVDPHDFRMWVCLHEETHRVQFTAVPWMGQHLQSLMNQFVDATDFDAGSLGQMVGDGAGELLKILRGEGERSLSDVFQNPKQREIVDQITGIMSLLEGHADVVMDGVGPSVVPSVATIRRKFSQRRARGGVDRVIRRLMGLDAKLRQYKDGAQFVRAVTDAVGNDGFNAVWTDASHLPGKAEILDPSAWLKRVHG
jgi:coenzyme F420 biosynthesis associated uncharacterized protein